MLTMTTNVKTGDEGLAERVTSLRKLKKLTQGQLAELIGLSINMVQKIEAADQYGSPETHDKLAQVLGVSVPYLLYGSEVERLTLPPGLTREDVEFLSYIALYLSGRAKIGPVSDRSQGMPHHANGNGKPNPQEQDAQTLRRLQETIQKPEAEANLKKANAARNKNTTTNNNNSNKPVAASQEDSSSLIVKSVSDLPHE